MDMRKNVYKHARAHTFIACTPHNKYVPTKHGPNQRVIFAYAHGACAHSYKGSDLAVYAARNNPAHKMTRHYRPCDVPAGAKVWDLHRGAHACTRTSGLRARVTRASLQPSPCMQCSALTSHSLPRAVPGLLAHAWGHKKQNIFF